MAVDYFLKIDGIEGESADAKHKNEIQIDSFSFGATQAGISAAGGGGGAGKAQFQDLHFTASANKSSPKLFLACATGQHIKSAILVARKAGKDQQEYLKITLTDVLVSGFQSSGAGGNNVVPLDQVSLNFAKIDMEYKPQDATGKVGGAVAVSYNVKEQKYA